MDKTLRAGIFGIAIVACVVMVAFGYSSLPFYPQGKSYEAFFADAGGISPGNDVNISGITVGKVSDVALAGDVAKVTFTVDRKIRLGDQTLVSIRTDTVLGERSLGVTPQGSGSVTSIPVARTTVPYTLNMALQDLGQNAGALDKEQLTQALGVLTDSFRDATPELRRTLDGVADVVTQHQRQRRSAGPAVDTREVGDRGARRPGRSGESTHHRRQSALRRTRRATGRAE